MNPNPVETFTYSPPITQDDTNMPCITIPLSDELYSYVDFRGPEVIEQGDLALIGNCSRFSYCDKKTRTCQPKRNVGSPCHHNMECFFGLDALPGHCANHSVCAVRNDLPPYYEATLHQWTLGDQWRSAVVAVLATGAVAICLVIGRQQAAALVRNVHYWIGQWKNRSSTRTTTTAIDGTASIAMAAAPFDDDLHVRRQQQQWWKQMPGLKWVYKRLHRGTSDAEAYYPLTDQERTEPPPAYQE